LRRWTNLGFCRSQGSSFRVFFLGKVYKRAVVICCFNWPLFCACIYYSLSSILHIDMVWLVFLCVRQRRTTIRNNSSTFLPLSSVANAIQFLLFHQRYGVVDSSCKKSIIYIHPNFLKLCSLFQCS
jgi:hypothetical protein